MDRDRALSLDKVRREVDHVRWESGSSNQSSTASSVRRTLYAAMSVGQGGQGHRLSKVPPPSVASASEHSPTINPNVELVLQSLNERWDTEVSRLNRYLLRNYNIAHGIEEMDDDFDDDDDAASDGRPGTAASLGTMLDKLKFNVSVSADEIRSSPPNESPAVIRLSESSDTPSQFSSNIETTPIQPKRPSHNTRRPHTAAPTQSVPSGHSRLALPVPAVPPAVGKAESVRSGRSSSSNASIGTGSTRRAYGVASSTLRGFLSGTALRERRRADAARPSPVCVNNDKPPQLDWVPPKLDL
ncbi:hypothetical protein PDIDSM_8015 [Penicillium digitatum]|nr:hypothetical protein PDIDSM_8015 [Penicillium digitatum]